MAKVFISYRRADTASVSGRIYDRLVAKFSRQNVFKDVDDIPAGVRFSQYIQDSLRQCSVELVIIGREWLTARKEDGTRRLDDSRDWVRLEVEAGFALGLTVIPVLVEGASLPSEANLPESLRDLIEINAIELRNDPDFSRDMDRLVAAVERVFAARPKRSGGGWFSRPKPATPSPPSTPDAAASSKSATPEFMATAASAEVSLSASAGGLAAGESKRTLEPNLTTMPMSAGAIKVPAESAMRRSNNGGRVGWPLIVGLETIVLAMSLVALLAVHLLTISWQVSRSPTTNPLYSVSMDSATDGWAVGDQGTILHYSNGAWSPVSSTMVGALHGVAMVSASEGWAVGDFGTILHYSNGTWSSVNSSTDQNLSSVSMDSATDGWAVGSEGAILHYSGGQWSVASNPTFYTLYSVFLSSYFLFTGWDGWAVGDNGTLVHYASII